MNSIVFRVMRLSQPDLQPPRDGYSKEDLVSDSLQGEVAYHSHAHPFAARLHASPPSDLLTLPQNFGIVYLGTQFAALVTVTNISPQPVSVVGLKVEIATDRHKTVLFDNTVAPLPCLGPGQRQEVVIRHDVKELGTHTLTTAGAYQAAADGERRSLQQVFKFSTANPLAVRTRHRVVGRSVFLEATLENATKAPMVLEAVQLQAAQPFAARPLLPRQPPQPGPLGPYLSSATVVPADGGAVCFLFQLSAPDGQPPHKASEGSGGGGVALGRVHIQWRGPMGEPALLQTQLISLAPAAGAQLGREVELALGPLPARVKQLEPFWIDAHLHNHTDRPTSSLKLSFAGGGGEAEAGGLPGPPGFQVLLAGPQAALLPPVPAGQAAAVRLQLLPLGCGLQRVAGLLLSDAAGGRIYDTLQPPVEVFVGVAEAGMHAAEE